MELNAILSKAQTGEPLERAELIRLLSPAGAAEEAALFAAAAAQRRRHGGDRIFAYGFVYLSTHCRNDCRFCAYRRSNPEARRYRKSPGDVLSAARELAADGVHLIDLTLGEDPAVDECVWQDEFAALITEVKRVTGLPVMISPGVAGDEALGKYAAAGADWYACYQETHNPELFARLRAGQDYRRRLDSKKAARAAGLRVEEGALCGVGETVEDLADSILAMIDLGAAQVRAMGYVPPAESARYPEKGWAESTGLSRRRELSMIAALRLAMPEALIPASLDVEGLAGLAPRLAAGANLITSLVPPGRGLAGVAQASLDIDNHARSVAGLRPVLAEMGLRLATPGEYRDWLAEH